MQALKLSASMLAICLLGVSLLLVDDNELSQRCVHQWSTGAPRHSLSQRLMDQLKHAVPAPRCWPFATGTFETSPNSDDVRTSRLLLFQRKTFSSCVCSMAPRRPPVLEQPGVVILGLQYSRQHAWLYLYWTARVPDQRTRPACLDVQQLLQGNACVLVATQSG